VSTVLQSRARDFSFSLTRVMIASLLVEHAVWSEDKSDNWIAEQWVIIQPLSLYSLSLPKNEHDQRATWVALDNDPNGKARGYGDGPLRCKM